MGTRKYKCQYCKEYIESNEELIHVMTGENLFGIGKKLHKKCYDFSEREKLELDSLVNTIMSIYDISIISRSFYIRLQDLRNGNSVYNQVKKKKQGYRYKLIEYAYKEMKPTIIKTMPKSGTIEGKMNYGFKIVENNIVNICNKLKARKLREKKLKEEKSKIVTTEVAKEIEIKREPKVKIDLPSWL